METKTIVIIVSIVVLAFLIGSAGYFFITKFMALGAAYKAKVLCPDVFVGGRDPESILREDLYYQGYKYFKTNIDYEERSVTSSFIGLAKGVSGKVGKSERYMSSIDDYGYQYPLNSNFCSVMWTTSS